MSLDWGHASPELSLVGGMLIGIACTMLLIGIGRIAGISDILNGLLGSSESEATGDTSWRLSFAAGLIAAPAALRPFLPPDGLEPQAVVASAGGFLLFFVGGILVAVGSQLANGCTSGHGICGLARFSRRSFVAVALFIAAALAVVYVMRHVRGVYP